MIDRRHVPRAAWLLAGLLAPALAAAPAPADGPKFDRVVIDADFPGAYQVEVADVNGDGKPDIVALGGSTAAWYENPGWTRRVITGPKETPGIISSATVDLDRDGKAEVAIAYEFAMNEPKKGKLGVAWQGDRPGDPWTFRHLADVGSIHRLRWGEFDGDLARPELVVAPLFGPESKPPTYDDPAELWLYVPGAAFRTDRWEALPVGREPAGSRHQVPPTVRPVLHAIDVAAPRLAGAVAPGESVMVRSQILTADNGGVRLIVPTGVEGKAGVGGWLTGLMDLSGAPGDPPKRGSSEVHRGKLRDGRPFVATVEPWHGTMVAVYLGQDNLPVSATRRVIDDTLAEGHALWVADVDGDGGDEVFAGHRGKDHRVAMYRHDGKDWTRTILDGEIAAQDLRGGDLDGDGVPDVVAVGGSTRNVVLYRFRK